MESAEHGFPRIEQKRRKFVLPKLGRVLGFVGLVSLGGAIADIIKNESSTQTPPSATPVVRLEKAPSSEVLLQATATALDERKIKDSFEEEAGFTREMFEEARRGTVLLKIKGELNGSGELVQRQGTGFVFKHDEKSTYIVTARHMFKDVGHATRVNVWRPNIDKGMYDPAFFTWSRLTDDPDLDISIIKMGGWNPEIPLADINYMEKQNLKNKNLLIVGFPGPFSDNKNPAEAFTLGSVMKTNEKVWGGKKNEAIGLSSPGSSGSPAFIQEGGKLKLVGVLNSIATRDVEVSPGHVQEQEDITLIRPLEIKNLMEAFE